MWADVAALLLTPGDGRAVARRVGIAIAVLGLAWTLLTAGIVALLWGASLLLARWLPLAPAILVAGGAAVLLAVLVLFARRRRRSPRPLALRLFSQHPVEALMAAAAMGFLASRDDEVPRLLLRAVLRQPR